MSATGYVRQSASQIASGQPVASAPVNAEFNQLVSAFGTTGGHNHDGTTAGCGPQLSLSSFIGLGPTTAGFIAGNGANGFNAPVITGTSNRITVANGTGASGNPTLDISAAYVGQSSITTLGTIATGVWNGTLIGGTYGGTGVNNGANTITLGGNVLTAGAFTLSGAHTLTFTTTANTALTLPTSGTLMAGSNNLSDVSSATTAANNILPSQSTHANQFLKTDGSGNLTWAAVSGASGGTVTSVTFTGDGTVLSSTPSSAVTSSGTVTATLATPNGGTVLGNTTSSAAAPTFSPNPVVGIPGTTSGSISIANGGVGGASVKIQNPGTTTGYNFNLPNTAGASGTILVSGGGGATSMQWSTATYPTSTTANQLLYSSSTSVIGGLTSANSSVLITNGSGVPSWATTLPSVTLNSATTATTQTPGDNTTKLATTAFVTAAVAASGSSLLKANNLSDLNNLGTALGNLGFNTAHISANGYYILPNGLYMQWGNVAGSIATIPVTFPIAFPNACFSVVITPVGASGGAPVYLNSTVTTTGFSIVNASASVNPIYWYAIGN